MAECYTFTVEDVCVLNIVDVNAVEAGWLEHSHYICYQFTNFNNDYLKVITGECPRGTHTWRLQGAACHRRADQGMFVLFKYFNVDIILSWYFVMQMYYVSCILNMCTTQYTFCFPSP